MLIYFKISFIKNYFIYLFVRILTAVGAGAKRDEIW